MELYFITKMGVNKLTIVHPWYVNWYIDIRSSLVKPYWFNSLQVLKDAMCRNPSFGLATKAKGLQGCGPKGSPGVTSGTPGSVGKCEGVNLHSQGNSHFGRWSPSGLPKLQRPIWGVKSQWLVALFISMESSWSVDF